MTCAAGCYEGSAGQADDADTGEEPDADGREEELGPCEVTWVEPQDGFRWVREDDQVGGIEDGFQRSVEVALNLEDGHPLYLWVGNSGLAAVTEVMGGRARFEDVSFPTDGEIELRVESTFMPELEDRYCGSWIRGSIALDLPACSLEDPASVYWINLAWDADPSAPWIQTEILARSYNARTAELYIDAGPGDSPVRTAGFVDEEALFEAVTLQDAAFGGRCLQVGCVDDDGDRGFSVRACFGVDSVVPAIEIVQPVEAQRFDDGSDISPEYPGVQIAVEIDTDQPGALVELWNDDCSQWPETHLPEERVWADASGHASGLTHIGDLDGDYTICARVTRPSENSAVDQVTVRFDTAVPALKIVRPNGTVPEDPADNTADDSLILMEEDELPYHPEANPNHTCEFTVLVDCEQFSDDVSLYARWGPDVGSLIETAPCLACSGLEDPACSLAGRAVFNRQILLDFVSLYASQGAVSSPDVRVVVDMLPASPEVTDPVCGETLSLAAPFTVRVSVESERDGSDVTLNVYDGAGNTLPGSPYLRANIDGQSVFESVLLVEGANFLEACGADRYDQYGCGPRCTLVVEAQ